MGIAFTKFFHHRSAARLGLVAAGLTAALAAHAETQPAPTPGLKSVPLPPGLSLPWRTIGIEREVSGGARQTLQKSAQALAASWLTAPKPLTELAKTRKLPTLNAQTITDDIVYGNVKPTLAVKSVALEPTWCTFMDRYVFAIEVVDAATNTLLAGRHVATARAAFDELDSAAQVAWLAGRLPNLAASALTAAGTHTAASDALHVGLTIGAERTRADEGSALCIRQLLEEQLAADYTIARGLGSDRLATIRDVLGVPATLTRPTRGIVLTWTRDGDLDEQAHRQLPVIFNLTASVVDTVFGKHLPIAYKNDWEFKLGSGGEIVFAVDPKFRSLLDSERATLRLADYPQVAKIDRAWVYLDRGRAWGLKMRDRLIADIGGQPVKGHVVRFFGPEAGIKSPRGFLINEGAILYIRKTRGCRKSVRNSASTRGHFPRRFR